MQYSRLKIILLSGPICAGKSTFCDQIESKQNVQVISSRDLIKALVPGVGDTRVALQRAGNRLDREKGGSWVNEAFAQIVSENDAQSGRIIVFDAARTADQISTIRDGFGASVFHIHFTAPAHVLKKRYEARGSDDLALTPYERAKANPTEKAVEELAELADVVVDTARCSEASVYVRATALLGLYPRGLHTNVDVLVGGQYGSEGKGNIVGHIAPEYQLLVRVGGPNAGHQVYRDPTPEVYYHLPSGTGRAPNARLLLGAGAVIYVPKLMQEISTHKVDVNRLSIDPQAMIIEDLDRYIESGLLADKISSTAQGVGWASARKITGRGGYESADTKMRLAKDVPELRPFIQDSQEILAAAYMDEKKILLEGTQGTSLSMHHGKYPWVTSRDTTVAGCLADSGIPAKRVDKIIMVCRTYPIRVGGPSGDLGIEITYEELAERSRIPIGELKSTEKTTTTKKQRRLAEFDWEQLKRSTQLNGPTDLALTFVDYLDIENRKAFRYEQLSEYTLRFIEEVERVSGVPVNLISTDFNWRNVIDRRAW